MNKVLTRSTWLLAFSGVAAVLFGVVALVWPSIALVTLVALFGAYALIGGVLTLIFGMDLATEHARHWIPMVLSGVAGLGVGVLTFFRPGITALALVYLIAFWAILTGILEFAAGIQMSGMVRGSWSLWLGGLLSVAFGVLVALRPGNGALAIVWVIGIYAILLGASRLFFAYRLNADRDAIKTAFTSPVATDSRQPTPVGR